MVAGYRLIIGERGADAVEFHCRVSLCASGGPRGQLELHAVDYHEPVWETRWGRQSKEAQPRGMADPLGDLCTSGVARWRAASVAALAVADCPSS